MYIEWNTKREILPGRSWYDEEGNKHNGELLVILDKVNKLSKLGVCRLVVKNKKNPKWYRVVDKKYHKNNDDATCTYTWKPRYDIDTIKKARKDKYLNSFSLTYREKKEIRDAEMFLTGTSDINLDDIKTQYDSVVNDIDALDDYDALVEYTPILTETD